MGAWITGVHVTIYIVMVTCTTNSNHRLEGWAADTCNDVHVFMGYTCMGYRVTCNPSHVDMGHICMGYSGTCSEQHVHMQYMGYRGTCNDWRMAHLHGVQGYT